MVSEDNPITYIEQLAGLRAELASARAERDAAQFDRDAARADLELMRVALEALRAEVDRLKARLDQNSSNSHRPPSTDPPGVPKPPKKKPTGRKKGGQRGRVGRARVLLPVDEVTQVVPCKPSHCTDCGTALAGDDTSPERHQVTEIPRVAPTVIEYQVHALRCPCGAVTHGRLPEGVTYSAFGPRLQALVVMLSAVYRLSKRNIQRLMADYLSIDLSVGSISKLEASMSQTLEQPVEEAKLLVREQAVAHADETGWREGKSKAWLWTVVTSVVVVFAVRLSRGAKVAKELLGEQFKGLLVTDRWSGYRWVNLAQRQLCWSHLIRDFQKLADSRGPAIPIGKALGEQAKLLFHAWHQVRDGTSTRTQFQAEVAQRIRPEVQRLLKEGASMPEDSDRKGMCEALLAAEPALWTFVLVEGVEPTNNLAERTVRHGVLWRRTSFGTQTPAGSRTLSERESGAGPRPFSATRLWLWRDKDPTLRVALAWSPTGSMFAVGGMDVVSESTVDVLDPVNRPSGPLAGTSEQKCAVTALAYSKSGDRLLVACTHGDLLLFDPRSWQLLAKNAPLGHKESHAWVNGVFGFCSMTPNLYPDSVFVGSREGRILELDPSTLAVRRTVVNLAEMPPDESGRMVELSGMATDPSLHWLAAVWGNSHILVFDLRAPPGSEPTRIRARGRPVFVPESDYVAVSDGSRIGLWNHMTGTLDFEYLDDALGEVTVIAAAPDGSYLEAGNRAGIVTRIPLR